MTKTLDRDWFVQAIKDLAGKPEGETFGVDVEVANDQLQHPEVPHYVLGRIVDEIARKAVVKTFDGLYAMRWDLQTISDVYLTHFRAKVDLRKIEEIPVIYRIAATIADLPSDVHSCKWCGGYTKNDMRGNCAACGAPRSDDARAWGYENDQDND